MTTDGGDDDCAWYWANPDSCGDWDDEDFDASACCACSALVSLAADIDDCEYEDCTEQAKLYGSGSHGTDC